MLLLVDVLFIFIYLPKGTISVGYLNKTSSGQQVYKSPQKKVSVESNMFSADTVSMVLVYDEYRLLLEDELELTGDLLYAASVASTLEVCLEEDVEDLACLVVVDEASWEDDDIGVVVLADELSNLRAPYETCAYCLMLVQRDGHAFARAADADADIADAILDALSESVSIVRVIDTCITPAAVVLYWPAFLLEILFNEFLQWVASVVAGESYFLYIHKCFVV